VDVRERARAHLRGASGALSAILNLTYLYEKVAYQRILQLTYVDDFLAALKTVFVKLFEPFLAAFIASLHAAGSGKLGNANGSTPVTWNFVEAFKGWDAAFDKLLRGFEDKAAQVRPITF
jgi:signal recognition particle receptor subunit alpha